MNHSSVPAVTRLTQNSTNRAFTLYSATAADWAGQWPTERTGDVLVSEAPGSAMGSLFAYWLGNKSLESPGVLEAIQLHLDDHDVVGVHVIFEFPQDAHSSLKVDLAQLRADALWGDRSKRIMATVKLQTWGGRKNDDAIFHSLQEVDVTDTILLHDLDELVSLRDGDESSDEIGRGHLEWQGPLEVALTDSICEFFGVERLDDISESLLAAAKKKYDPQPPTFETVTVPVKVNVTVFPGARLEDAIRHLQLTATTETDGVIVTGAMVERRCSLSLTDATALQSTAKAVQRTEAESSAETQPLFMALLAQAEAISINGHMMVREWQTAEWIGEPDNEVFHFAYRHNDIDHYVILTEDAITTGVVDSRSQFLGVDHEGTSLSIQFYKLAPLTVNDLAIKS